MKNNIYKTSTGYIIRKTFYSKRIYYGKYDTYEEALKQRKILEENNWIKNRKTNYKINDEFPQYHLEEKNGIYHIINQKSGKNYGNYKNLKYAKIIKKILPFYQENIELKIIEQQAQKEFYKYIHYNKLQNRYHIIYKATTLATYKSLKEALIERDLIVKYDGDEELMCEAEINYEDYKHDLPPLPTK